LQNVPSKQSNLGLTVMKDHVYEALARSNYGVLLWKVAKIANFITLLSVAVEFWLIGVLT